MVRSLFLLAALSTPPPAKVAPITLDKLVSESDAILLTTPTKNAYRVNVVYIVFCRLGSIAGQIAIVPHAPAPKNSEIEQQWNFGGLREPAVLFLKHTQSPGTWTPVDYFHAWMPVENGRVACRPNYAWSPTRPFSKFVGYSVGFGVLFPKSLHPSGKDYVAKNVLIKELQGVAEVSSRLAY